MSPRAESCDFCNQGQGLNPYLTATRTGFTFDSSFTASNSIFNRNSTINLNGKSKSWLIYTLTGFYPVNEDLTVRAGLPFANKNNLDFESSTNTNSGSVTSGLGDISISTRYTSPCTAWHRFIRYYIWSSVFTCDQSLVPSNRQ